MIDRYKKYLSGANILPLAKVIEHHRHINIKQIWEQYERNSLIRANVTATRGVLGFVKGAMGKMMRKVKQHYFDHPLSSGALVKFKAKLDGWTKADDGMSQLVGWLATQIVQVSEEKIEKLQQRLPYPALMRGSIKGEFYEGLRKPEIEDILDRTNDAIEEQNEEIEKVRNDPDVIRPRIQIFVIKSLRKKLADRARYLEHILSKREQAKRAQNVVDLTGDLSRVAPPSPTPTPPISPQISPAPSRSVSPGPPQNSANLSPPARAAIDLQMFPPSTIRFAPPKDMPAVGLDPRNLFKNLAPQVSPARQPHPMQRIVNQQAHPNSPQEQQDEEKAWDVFMANEGGRVLRSDYIYNRARRNIRPRLKYYKTRQEYIIPEDKPYIIGGDQVKEIAYVERHQIPEHAPEENHHELFVKELRKEPVYHASKKITDIGDNIRVSLFNHSIHFYFSGSPVQRALKIMAERISDQASSTRECRLLTTRMVKGKRIMRTIISKRDLQHTPRIAIQNMLARSTAKHFILRYEGSGGSIHRRYQNKMHLL
jgi:hypothetical protein